LAKESTQQCFSVRQENFISFINKREMGILQRKLCIMDSTVITFQFLMAKRERIFLALKLILCFWTTRIACCNETGSHVMSLMKASCHSVLTFGIAKCHEGMIVSP
jgi:hypothetical protein